MATELNYIKYVMEQISLSDTSYKKMFGEYMLYYKEVPILLVCDNCVFVKITKETTEILGCEADVGYPYDGAKLHYMLDVDNADIVRCVVLAVYNERTKSKK